MKLAITDLKVKGRNEQIIEKIEKEFESLENFAETIGMSINTLRQYLKQSKPFTGKFKDNLSKHLGDYDSLYKSKEQQIEEFVEVLTKNIYSYKSESDIKVLEYVKNLSLEYGSEGDKAKSYRNLGMYCLNHSQYGLGLTFYNSARVHAQKDKNLNIECMIVSEIVSVYTHMHEYREGEKVFRDFERDIEGVGPERKFWYYYYGAVLYMSERIYSYAKPVITKALACANNYNKLRCYNLLGICHKNERDFNNALYYYREALKIAEHDRDRAVCYNNLANLYIFMKNKQLAEENINTAMQLVDPNDIDKCIKVYDTYAEIEGTEKSIIKLFDLLENAPQSVSMPYILDAINTIMNKSKDRERIKRLILKYIELNKENEKLLENLYKLLGTLIHKMEVNG